MARWIRKLPAKCYKLVISISQQPLSNFFLAQGSTASMGLFDKKAHKEEPELKKKRKNTAPTFGNSKEENKRNLDILDQVNKNQGSNKVGK